MHWRPILISGVFFMMLVPPGVSLPADDSGASSQDFIAGMAEWAEPARINGEIVDGTPYILENDVQTADSRAYQQTDTGTHCVLYVDSAASPYPNATTRQNLVNEFDTRIYPTDTTVFGSTYNSIDIYVRSIDGQYGVGGYFSPYYPRRIYVDSADISSWGYQIIAHEFQHLIHHYHDSYEELWFDEGHADLAIVVNYGGSASGVLSHLYSFEHNPDNDLTEFNNRGYDYGSALTYALYLWEHYGGNATTRALVDNQANGFSSVTTVLSNLGYSDTGTEVFYKWTVANIVDDTSFDSGQWGYNKISIEVESQSVSSYPASGGGTVNDWAADYIKFTGSGNETLRISFDGTAGGTRVYLALMALDRSKSQVVRMSLDASMAGEYSVENFGLAGRYYQVYMVIATSSSTSYTWSADLIDNVPPNTRLEVTPEVPDGGDGWYVTVPTIRFVSEPGATVSYHWDSEAEQEYTGTPITAPQGEHTLYYHAVDKSGNIELEKSRVFRVDSIAPETSITISPDVLPEDEWYTNPVQVALSADEEADIYYRIDTGPERTYSQPIEIPEGVHTLRYHAEDVHGNVEAEKSRKFMVDTTVPTATPNIAPMYPDGNNGWYTTTPVITFTTDEDGAKVMYRWDWDTQEYEYSGTITPAEGIHILYYYAVDQAGNRQEVQSFEIKLDTTPPAMNITIDPEEPNGREGWYTQQPIIQLYTEEINATIYYRWDDDEDWMTYTEELTAEEGVHTLYYYVEDEAGNAGQEMETTVAVDTIPPVTTLSISPDVNPGEWYTTTPRMTFKTSEKAEIYYHWNSGRDTKFTGSLVVPEGDNVLYFHAVDIAGNREDEQSIRMKVDTKAPTGSATFSRTSIYTGEQITVTISAHDSNGIDGYFVDFGDGKNSGWVKTTKISHVYNRVGSFQVTVKAKDKAGIESTLTTQGISVKSRPGVFGGGGDGTAGGGSTVNIAGRPVPVPALVALLVVILVAVGASLYAVRRRRKEQEYMAPVPPPSTTEISGYYPGYEEEPLSTRPGTSEVVPSMSYEPIQQEAPSSDDDISMLENMLEDLD